jgi:BolA protein
MPSQPPPPRGPDRVRWLDETLRAGLDAEHVDVQDDSARHAGHAGAAGGGGHFRVLIVAARFRGQPPLARQRAVYALLGTAVGTAIHALALRTLTPEEWQAERDRPPARAPRG